VWPGERRHEAPRRGFEGCYERPLFGGARDFAAVRHLTMRGTNVGIGRTLGELAVERHGRTRAECRSDYATVTLDAG